nr:alpha-glucosidase C-terminal domain-containing protein [Tepidibacter formicigenes]
MTNPYFDNINLYKDVESINYYKILKNQGKDEKEIIKILKSKSRDNSRTPMQWNNSNNAGFTIGTPWLSVSKNYKEINAQDALNDKNSIFYHYQKLIKLRKEFDIISYGDYEPILEEHEDIFAYIRTYKNEKLLVINNFYGKETIFKLPSQLNFDEYESNILISNYSNSSNEFKKIKLRPYESIVYHIEK